MKVLILILFTAIFFEGLIACSSLPEKIAAGNRKKNRVEYLSRQLKKSRVQLEKLKSENLVLRTRLERGRRRNLATRSSLPEQKKNYPLTSMSILDTNEQRVFKGVISAYRNKNHKNLKAYTSMLIKKYPKSIYGDNALYLYGKYLYDLKKYSLALRPLDRALKLFPKGNKRASILFIKSMAYKNLRLVDQSKEILREIVHEYPGSMEANQAQLELGISTPNKL